MSKAVLAVASWFESRHGGGVGIRMAIAAMGAMRAASRTALCEFFVRTFALPYGAAVRARDEGYFIQQPLPGTMPVGMSGLSMAFATAWVAMSDADKAEAWARLQEVVDDAEAWSRDRSSTAP